MLFLELPNDIIYNILKSCYIGNHRQLIISNNELYNNYYELKNGISIKILRIKLWLKIMIHKRKLFRDINYIFNKHFRFDFSGIMRYRDICLLYSPHVQYGPCRFCMKNLNEHKYYKMIKIYLELITKK